MVLCKQMPDSQPLAVQTDGRILSYGQVQEFARSLADLCTDQRQLACILAQNNLGSLASYVACLESQRVVPLMLDAHLSEDMLGSLLDQYQPRYVFAPVEYGGAAAHNWSPVLEYCDYAVFDTAGPALQLFDELALLLTTSGSTGTSKLVRLSYNNVRSNAESIAQYLGLNESQRPITSLPMSYTYGLSVINSHVLCGSCIAVTNEAVLQQGFWDAFRALEATSMAGVPYTYQMLQRLRFNRMDLPSLTTLTQAGGKLSAELHQYFAEYAQETGRKFFVMYGQTEATARMSYLPPERSLEKVGSIGIAIPGGAFSLVNDVGSAIQHAGEEGELVYQGPNVSLGYAFCRDDLAKGDENQGVLATGDMARFDEDGYFYITGRKKRFLKLFGKRVSLDECEQHISGHFGIESACAGTDDCLCIYVVDASYSADIQPYMATKLGVHPSAVKVKPIPAIPRSDSGKILYKDLPAGQ